MYIWPMCPFCSFQLYWKQRSAAGKLQYFCFLFQETTNLSSCLQCSYTHICSKCSRPSGWSGRLYLPCISVGTRHGQAWGAPLCCCSAAAPGHPRPLLTSSIYVYVCARICTKEKGRGASFPRGGAAGPLGVSVAPRSAAPARGRGTAVAPSVPPCRRGASLRMGQG